MHGSVMEWGREIIKTEDVCGKRILEVGAQNVNGSFREIIMPLQPQEYIGTDMQIGDGVDIVCSAEDIVSVFGDSSFDVVVCTEAMEHFENWKSAIQAIFNVCKPLGLLLITTRGVGMPYHPYPDDYWRFTIDDFRKVFAGNVFSSLQEDDELPGLMAKIVKTTNSIDTNIEVTGVQ